MSQRLHQASLELMVYDRCEIDCFVESQSFPKMLQTPMMNCGHVYIVAERVLSPGVTIAASNF